MLCYVMLCYVMLCYVMLCYVMLCYVMLCYVMLCYVMLCYVMLCYVMLCYVMLCYVVIYNIIITIISAGNVMFCSFWFVGLSTGPLNHLKSIEWIWIKLLSNQMCVSDQRNIDYILGMIRITILNFGEVCSL